MVLLFCNVSFRPLFRMVKKQIALELGEPWRYCFVTVGFFSMLCVVLKD